MEKFTALQGIAVPFPDDNIDTDAIYPALFLRTTKRFGLGGHAFHTLRFNPDGSEKPDFILNRTPYRDAKIIIAGKNFACGSSREHAVWSLMDFGIRCVIAESFGDIFFNNSRKNGLLPIVLDAETVALLMAHAQGPDAVITVDLTSQTVTAGSDAPISFTIDTFFKHCLLNGLDDIGMTMEKKDIVAVFEAQQKTEKPWLYKE